MRHSKCKGENEKTGEKIMGTFMFEEIP